MIAGIDWLSKSFINKRQLAGISWITCVIYSMFKNSNYKNPNYTSINYIVSIYNRCLFAKCIIKVFPNLFVFTFGIENIRQVLKLCLSLPLIDWLIVAPTEEVITFLECFTRHYRSSIPSQSSPSSLDLQPCQQYVIKANLSPPTVSLEL